MVLWAPCSWGGATNTKKSKWFLRSHQHASLVWVTMNLEFKRVSMSLIRDLFHLILLRLIWQNIFLNLFDPNLKNVGFHFQSTSMKRYYTFRIPFLISTQLLTRHFQLILVLYDQRRNVKISKFKHFFG